MNLYIAGVESEPNLCLEERVFIITYLILAVQYNVIQTNSVTRYDKHCDYNNIKVVGNR